MRILSVIVKSQVKFAIAFLNDWLPLTVATYFAALGIDVISADNIAKELTRKAKPAFKAIHSHFGDAVLTITGELDRRYLRQIIFQNLPYYIQIAKSLY